MPIPLCIYCAHVVIHSFRHMIFVWNIENQCHNDSLYASNRFQSRGFYCMDNMVFRLVRFYRNFHQINFGYNFINCITFFFFPCCLSCDLFFSSRLFSIRKREKSLKVLPNAFYYNALDPDQFENGFEFGSQ